METKKRKTAKTAENAEGAEENTAAAKPSNETDPETERTEETIKRVYIGPSIPKHNLRNSQILSGTETEIDAYIGAMSERYPEIKYLLVTTQALSAAQKKVAQKGNILHKYYQDMAAKAIMSRRGG